MKTEDKLKMLLDRIREQSYDPQLFFQLDQAIKDAIGEAYEKGVKDTLSRVKNPDTTGK